MEPGVYKSFNVTIQHGTDRKTIIVIADDFQAAERVARYYWEDYDVVGISLNAIVFSGSGWK